MNKWSIVAAVLGGLGLCVAAYVMFGVMPNIEYLENVSVKSDAQMHRLFDLRDEQVNLGMLAMGLGLVGFLTAIGPAIKTKHPVAFAAIADCLLAFFGGAYYGTHMFS